MPLWLGNVSRRWNCLLLRSRSGSFRPSIRIQLIKQASSTTMNNYMSSTLKPRVVSAVRSNEQVAHFALRVPLLTNVRGRKLDTVETHNSTAEKSGRVALAKFGQAGTRARVDQLQTQIGC